MSLNFFEYIDGVYFLLRLTRLTQDVASIGAKLFLAVWGTNLV